MAIAFRAFQDAHISSPNGTGHNGETGSLTINKPTGTVNDDILILSVVINYGNATLTGRTLPSGFTLLWDTWQSTSGDHWVVAWKRAASEGSNYTIQWTCDTEYVYADGIVAVYSGCNTGTVVDDYGEGSATTTTSHVAPSKTATYTNDMMLALAVEDNYSSSTCSGFTERADNSSTLSAKLYDKALSASGATGTADIVTGSSGSGRAGSILLIDATPTGGGGGGLSIPVAMAQYRQRWN